MPEDNDPGHRPGDAERGPTRPDGARPRRWRMTLSICAAAALATVVLVVVSRPGNARSGRAGAPPAVSARAPALAALADASAQTLTIDTATTAVAGIAVAGAPWPTRAIDPGPLASYGRDDAVVAVIGDDVIVLRRDGGDLLTTSTGAWRTIAPPPRPLPTGIAVWSGTELLLWGGSQPDEAISEAGLAYDPAANSWRAIPAAPILARGPFTYGFMNGEMLVWGGQRFDGARRAPGVAPDARRIDDAAAYNPSTNSWRVLDSRAPVEAVGQLIARDSDTAVVPVNMASGDLTVAHYQYSGDTWTLVPSIGGADIGTSIIVVGDMVYALVAHAASGAVTADVEVQRLDADGTWSTLPPPPVSDDVAICPQSLMIVANQLVAARCGTSARYVDNEWQPLPAGVLGGRLIPLAHGVLELGDGILMFHGP